jgi:UDP-2-acetamido-2,6-beta-L-arabino-hexul-4-ose reductase
MRVGITGQSGFIGTHLAKYVQKRSDTVLVPFEDGFFSDDGKLREFVNRCDVIIHLAAASRMPSEQELYNLNVGLVKKVIAAMEAENVMPLVIFSSSTHEVRDTAYGRAKMEGRMLFETWAKRHKASFVGFVFPNIYGPGAKVHYASFIANFAWEINHGVTPKVKVDAALPLKYVRNLCEFIGSYFEYKGVSRIEVPFDVYMKVTDILSLFYMFSKMSAADVKSYLWFNNNLKNLHDTFLSYR